VDRIDSILRVNHRLRFRGWIMGQRAIANGREEKTDGLPLVSQRSEGSMWTGSIRFCRQAIPFSQRVMERRVIAMGERRRLMVCRWCRKDWMDGWG
jgi:hypothetical protein